MAETKIYSVVWQICGKDIRLASRFYVPGFEGYLPFFICGDELKTFEKGGKVELGEDHLLKGILYGLYEFDHNPKPWNDLEDRKTLLYLLDVLGNGFRFDSPEKMVLDVASGMRQENGNHASRIVLEVGSELIPRSSKIKSDLICDLWAVISEEGGNTSLFERIIALVVQMNLNDIQSDAREVICYDGLCAHVFLKKERHIDYYLQKYVYPNVSMQQLKNNIKSLLENPGGFTPQELRIV